MITARLNNVRVYAEECSDRSLDYRCPGCGERVVLARGSVKIPHFKHQAHTACEYSGETLDHLRAKAWLYKNLKNSPYVEEVEAECSRFEGIRPDVAFKRSDDHSWVGIEIQHSGISYDEIIDRCIKYKNNGVHILWIATEKLYKKIIGCYYDESFEIRLSHQSRTFIKLHGALTVFTGNGLMAFTFKNVVRTREGYNYYDGYTGETWTETLSTVFTPRFNALVFVDSFNLRYPNHIVSVWPRDGWDDFEYFDEFYGGNAS